jgi:heme-degrading monooxygenase HmoA
MTVVTVFRSRLRDGVDAAYSEVAERMSRLVETMDGFIDRKFFVASDGERVTLVRFADAAAQRAWAAHPDHVAAQRRGRDEFYECYDISVSDETYSRTYPAPDNL